MIVHEIEPLERYTKEKSRHTHAHSQSLIHLIVSTRYCTQNIVWFLFRYLCLSIPFTVGIFVKVCVCSACMCMCVFRSYVSFYVVSMLFSLILFFFITFVVVVVVVFNATVAAAVVAVVLSLLLLHCISNWLTYLAFDGIRTAYFHLNSCFVFPSLCRSFSRTIRMIVQFVHLEVEWLAKMGQKMCVFNPYTRITERRVIRLWRDLRYLHDIYHIDGCCCYEFFFSIPLNSWMCSFHDCAAAPYYDV